MMTGKRKLWVHISHFTVHRQDMRIVNFRTVPPPLAQSGREKPLHMTVFSDSTRSLSLSISLHILQSLLLSFPSVSFYLSHAVSLTSVYQCIFFLYLLGIPTRKRKLSFALLGVSALSRRPSASVNLNFQGPTRFNPQLCPQAYFTTYLKDKKITVFCFFFLV